jgi:hypothetical protein
MQTPRARRGIATGKDAGKVNPPSRRADGRKVTTPLAPDRRKVRQISPNLLHSGKYFFGLRIFDHGYPSQCDS